MFGGEVDFVVVGTVCEWLSFVVNFSGTSSVNNFWIWLPVGYINVRCFCRWLRPMYIGFATLLSIGASFVFC